MWIARRTSKSRGHHLRRQSASIPAMCNAAETLLVHEAIAKAFLPRSVEKLRQAGVEIRGDSKTSRYCPAKVQRP